MNDTSSDNNPSKVLKWFPGTPEQEKQFRQWMEERDEPLWFEDIEDWLENNAMDLVEGDNGSVVQQISDKIARDFQKKISPTATVKLPGYGYPLDRMPEYHFPVIKSNQINPWCAGPLYLRELCMLKVVEEITNQPEWWVNVHDAQITDNWKKEILGLDWNDYVKYADFTPSMADWCIEELKQKADLYEKTGLIPVLDYDACVIKSDKLVPDTLKQELCVGSQKLQQAISGDKLSHNGITFHLIDPSMCPLIYIHSRILPDRSINRTTCLEACGKGDILDSNWVPHIKFLSNDGNKCPFDDTFQWLPCDVVVDEAGNAKVDSYINNLHPIDHADMYTTIERFITLALPAWDVIYRWPEEFCHQRITNEFVTYDCKVPHLCAGRECSWLNIPTAEFVRRDTEISKEPTPPTRANGMDGHLLNLKLERNESHLEKFLRQSIDEGHEWCHDMIEGRENHVHKWFYDTHPLRLPEPELDEVPVFSKCVPLSSTDARSSAIFSPKNNRLQVIVQLTEIRLSPEKPEYKGDLWKVDGMLNEHIVSTALFCYDSDNITDGHLYFDTPPQDVVTDFVHETPNYDTLRAFGILPGGKDFQVLGRVRIDPGTAIFYPNIYRHHQGSFSLADSSRSGYRKVLKLCLVDPSIPIISTSNIPPQQWAWWKNCKIHNEGLDLVGKLPPELQNMVFSDADFPITNDEAKRLRRLLELDRIPPGVFGWESQFWSDDESENDEGQNDEGENDEGENDEGENDEGENDEGENDESQYDGAQRLGEEIRLCFRMNDVLMTVAS
ncbi:hypothetical protein CFAM422_001081 [Trichoderma lentiforme]|uniref:Uncharacterized protein n=1 Tax=Trichoderma lentiforme TaxID=1567552 RepID=A0A9P4XQR6_9HYPO|nr:hypothetical protein CFAM422_001081 [Trichoderma lentiforme]